MELYMNADTLQIFDKKELLQFFIQQEHTAPGLIWKDGPERPYSGTCENARVWKYKYRYQLNGKEHLLTILKITK